MPGKPHAITGGMGLPFPAPDAIEAGAYLFLSGRIGMNLETGAVPRSAGELPESARELYASRYIDAQEWPMTGQTWWIYEAFRRILETFGADLTHLVRTNTYFRDLEDFPAHERARAAIIPADPPPSTVLEIPYESFPDGIDLFIDGVAVLPGGPSRDVVRSKLGTGAHYSWGVRTGEMTWAAGQTPTNPISAQYVMGPGDLGLEGRDLATGNLHLDGREGPATAQTWMAYWRIRKIIEDAGASMDDILCEKIYLRSMRHLPAVERVRRKIYSVPEKAPPSLYAEVINMGRNTDCLLEIDVVAAQGDREIIGGHTDGLGRLGAAGRMGGPFLSLGGRVARIPETGRIVRSPRDLDERQNDLGDAAEPLAIQARWIYDRIRQFLNEKGSSLAELIKVELYVTRSLNLTSLDAVHKAVFPDGPPAISVIPVPSVDPDPRVEIKICGLSNRPGR